MHNEGVATPVHVSTWAAIRRQLCPRCRQGSIFQRPTYLGLPKMHERCPVCGLKFDREPGYFLGAMYISYGIAVGVITLLAFGVWGLTHWTLGKVILGAAVVFLPFALPISTFARVLWIHFDQAVDPERSQ